MKSNKNISLKKTIWIYLAIFSVLILSFLWLFQVIFLNKYYEWYKTKELKESAYKIKTIYNTNNNLESVFNNLLFEKGICIDIVTKNKILTYNNNLNRSCSPINDVEIYKKAIEKRNGNDIVLKTEKNNKYNRKILVYGFTLDDDNYFFLTTSIAPIDSTVTILKNQLLIVTFVILTLSFIIGFFISKKLSKPIINLNNSAKNVAKGRYDEIFVSNSNISEIKELANSLNYAKDELSKTNDLRKDLMANVSHDLKTPLTMIKAYAEMVKDITYKDDKKREENLNVIIDEVDRLSLLVNDILDLSVIQSNIYETNITEFDLIDTIKTIINHFEIFTITEDYNFILNSETPITLIKADKKKIEQVIYNLISNAINYTGNDKKIIINVLDNKNNYRVEIIDSGKGIDEKEIDLIWEKYYKNDKKHKRNIVGTGLGLSIVKSILELHNYKYGVISKKDKGTTFYFELKKD